MTVGYPEWTWKIDGRVVKVGDWRGSGDLHGHSRFAGLIDDDDARRIRQGSVLVGYVAGREGWRGRLSRSPFPFRGTARIDAGGDQEQFNKYRLRHLYLSRDVTRFLPMTGPPWNLIGGGREAIRIENGDNQIVLRLEGETAVLNTQGSGPIFAAPKTPGGLTRVRFDWTSLNATTVIELRYVTGAYPGAPNFVDTPATSLNATSGAVNKALVGLGDELLVQLTMTSSFTVGASGYWIVLRNVRVAGIAEDDVFLTSQVVSDYGTRLGLDTTLVRGGVRNAMPLDVSESESPLEVFDRMALYEEWHPPRIISADGVPLIEFGPWDSKVWTAYLARDIQPDLVRMEDFNAVRVLYDQVGDLPAERTRTVDELGLDDPLEGTGLTNTLDLELSEPQADDQLALAVATANLPWAAGQKYTGRLRAGGVKGSDPYAVLPGDTVRVPDFGPLERVDLRVHGYSWTKDSVEWGIEAPATSGLLARALLAPRPPGPLPPIPPRPTERDMWLARMEHLGVSSMKELSQFGRKTGKKKAGAKAKAKAGKKTTGKKKRR
jgi:hypothetical protein